MASVEISSSGGHLGGGGGDGGGGGPTSQTYYCFECDRTLTIIATSDSGLICPNCGDVVLEEFETPSSSPPPLLQPRSTTLIDLQNFFPTSDDLHSFFPTSDTDSDIELPDPLPPPPPPPFFATNATTSYVGTTSFTGGPTILLENTNCLSNLHIRPPRLPRSPSPPPPLLSRDNWDLLYPSDTEVRYLQPPSLPPPPRTSPPFSAVDRCPLWPQLPGPSAQTTEYISQSPTQHSRFDSELDELRPPPPPPPPPEHLLPSPPPLSPSSAGDMWESFYSPTESEEDIPNQHMTSLIQSSQWPPLPPPLPRLSRWEDYFDHNLDQESNIPDHQSPLDLQPPPPPPWLQPSPTQGLQDLKMTETLVAEWECHQCAICLDNFELNQMVKLMPCKHLYHSSCILRWLDLHKSCPVCRHKLPSH